MVSLYLQSLPVSSDSNHNRALGQRPPCPEDLARQLNITFPKAAAEAFAKQLGDAKKFRLIYVSGMSAERDPTKSLWVMAEFRRIRVDPLLLPVFKS